MLRYWEVVDDDGVIVAAGLEDTKHQSGQSNQQTPARGGVASPAESGNKENNVEHPAKEAASDS